MFNKKMILMLVVLTALFAGAAFAGDYTVYGKLHSSLNMFSDGDNSRMDLTSNTSRFGLKGSQELNENFTFIWQFEQKLDTAKSGSNLVLSNRNSFVGVKGTWGTFLGGIHDTPFKTLGRKTTFYFDELGDFRQVAMGWDLRVKNVLVYASPDFSGFNFTLAYQLDQGNKLASADPDNYEASTAFSGNAMYSKDALLLGVAYESHSKGYTGTDNAETGLRFAGKYTMEKVAFAAMYQSLSDVSGVADLKASTMGGEVKFNMNEKFALKGGYYMTDPDTDTDNDDYSLMTFGIDHKYAKNVAFYLQYAAVANGDAAMTGLGGGAHGSTYVSPTAAGESVSGFSFGTWFTF